MFEFSWPYAFLLLPLPWLIALAKPSPAKQPLRLRMPSYATIAAGGSISSKQSRYLSIPEAIIWIALVIACANPTYLDEPVVLPSEGRDIMLAVDLSDSMREEDMAYQGNYIDRLSVVKAVLADFVEQRQGDRLGLILFADTAFLQTPLTRDLSTVSQMLSEAQIGLVGRATAIGDAIGLAVKRFEEKEKSNRILILLTDGQNTSGNLQPEEALVLAREAGIKVYTVGVGSDGRGSFGLFGMSSMSMGGSIDETTLKHIASETGGMYFRAKDVKGLQQIYTELDKLEPISEDTQTFRPSVSLFYWPLLVAMGLITLLLIFKQLRALLRGRD